MNQLSSKANFSWTIVDDVIVITDLYNEQNPTMSVTNDIEQVVRCLFQQFPTLEDYSVIYRDTEGCYDQIIIRNNAFFGFIGLAVTSLQAAIRSLIRFKEAEISEQYILDMGYSRARQLEDQTWIAIGELIGTSAIYMDVNLISWDRRYCYDDDRKLLIEFYNIKKNSDIPCGWITKRPL